MNRRQPCSQTRGQCAVTCSREPDAVVPRIAVAPYTWVGEGRGEFDHHGSKGCRRDLTC